jgi:hypothetical protein
MGEAKGKRQKAEGKRQEGNEAREKKATRRGGKKI